MQIIAISNYPMKTELEKEVKAIMLSEADNYEHLEDYMTTILCEGNVNGMREKYIHEDFFNNHKSDIFELINVSLDLYGFNTREDMFAGLWDLEDQWLRQQNNQNLLAWFCFEEIVREIGISWDLDIQAA